MQYKMRNIAHIRNGYSHRGKVTNQTDGDTYIIQMKDLDNGYSVIKDSPHKIERSDTIDKHLLQKGEVLLLARGANNLALVYNKDFDRAIAASAFFVIRLNNDKVLPEYVAWYINQLPVQNYFRQQSEGTMIRGINKKTIEEISMKTPNLTLQKQIVELYKLSQKEQQLLQQIADKKQRMINQFLLNQIL